MALLEYQYLCPAKCIDIYDVLLVFSVYSFILWPYLLLFN